MITKIPPSSSLFIVPKKKHLENIAIYEQVLPIHGLYGII